MAEVSFIEQSHEILGIFNSDGTGPQDFIAHVARTCYRSEPKSSDANEKLVRSLIKNGHHAMLEHSFLSVRFTTDRAIANELVRHRHFSFAQESTRYVNSSKRGFEFIMPPFCGSMEHFKTASEDNVRDVCQRAANTYEAMLECGCVTPEIARAVLPLCTATRIVVSGNFREWRHMFSLRCAPDAHPQMRALMTPLLEELREQISIVFDDLEG